MRTSPRPPKARKAFFADYVQIADLEYRHGLSPKNNEEWTHLWLNNPAYREEHDWPIGWVLEDSNCKIVGYVGNLPLLYELNRKRILVATSRAWVVEARYRSYATLLLDYFFSQKYVKLYLTTSLNAEAFAAYQFFEPTPVPVGSWDEASFWITHYPGFVSSSLIRKQLTWAKPFVFPISSFLFIADRLTGSSVVKGQSEVNLEICSRFDARFDDFWEQLRRVKSDVVLGVRSQETLNWHFKYALLNQKAWILASTCRSRLVGYAIFYREDSPEFGLKRIRLADFQTLQQDNSLLHTMIVWALQECRRHGIHMLEIVGLDSEKMEVLGKLRPRHRKFDSWLSFYKTSDLYLQERLKEPTVWDLSLFDGDSSV